MSEKPEKGQTQEGRLKGSSRKIPNPNLRNCTSECDADNILARSQFVLALHMSSSPFPQAVRCTDRRTDHRISQVASLSPFRAVRSPRKT